MPPFNASSQQQKTVIAAVAVTAVVALVYSLTRSSSSSSSSSKEENASNTDQILPPSDEALPEKIEGGKEEGLTEEIAALVSRICTLYARLDTRCRDHIKVGSITTLCRNNRAACHVMKNCGWDSNVENNYDYVTCNEFVHYFLKVKSEYGHDALLHHLNTLEISVEEVPANITTKRGSGMVDDDDETAEVDEQVKQDLPSNWLPIITSRIISIFRRIDLNGDHGIDKYEILKLHGGDKHTTESMFADLDTNHDGSISPQEFVQYFFRVLKRCEEKDKKERLRNSPLRVKNDGSLERDTSALPPPTQPIGTTLTKGRKLVNKIASILEGKLTERDERLHY